MVCTVVDDSLTTFDCLDWIELFVKETGLCKIPVVVYVCFGAIFFWDRWFNVSRICWCLFYVQMNIISEQRFVHSSIFDEHCSIVVHECVRGRIYPMFRLLMTAKESVSYFFGCSDEITIFAVLFSFDISLVSSWNSCGISLHFSALGILLIPVWMASTPYSVRGVLVISLTVARGWNLTFTSAFCLHSRFESRTLVIESLW